MAETMRRIGHKVFDAIDRVNYRVVYIALAVLLAVPFIFGHWEVKPKPRAITRGLFNAIEECAETGKPVFLLNTWIMDSRGENQPQFECLIDHLMRLRVKFVMLSFFADTAIVGREICQKTEAFYKERYGDDYLQYGRDWLMIGYRPVYQTGGWQTWVPNMKTKGIVGSFDNDYMGHNLTEYPIMRRPESALREEAEKRAKEGKEEQTEQEAKPYLQLGDFGLVIEVHYTAQIAPVLTGLVRLDKDLTGPDGKPKIEMASATVNMVVNQMLPYYDSGDLCGILAGVQGAVEYSELLQDTYGEGPSREDVSRRANAYSMGVLFVLFVIVLGNLSTIWKTLHERREARGGD
jgi:hypothetical protein